MISIGLVGCGAVAHSNYAKTLIGREAYGVRYVFDPSQTQAESAARLFGAQRVDLAVLLERADAVIVATPPRAHAELVRASLSPGRTIVCEKPFTASRADAESLVEEAEKAGARLFVGHFRRSYPHLALARELVLLGAIGRVEVVFATEGGRFRWNAVSSYTTLDPVGGVLWDTGSHTLDMALFAAALDNDPMLAAEETFVERDRAEPSHDIRCRSRLSTRSGPVELTLRVSRKEALPNLITLQGTRGSISFTVDLDDRVRLTAGDRTAVLLTERVQADLMECVDLQFRWIFQDEPGADLFRADRFVGQIGVLEAFSAA